MCTFSCLLICIALPVLELVTNKSVVVVMNESVSIEFIVVRAVPDVSRVMWNFTAGIVDGEEVLSLQSSQHLICNDHSNCTFSDKM